MSYQVLARKWRPRNFQEVVGQQHVLTALSNGLALNRVHHAYLFSGTRGVGKTTIARILAKSLNCEQGVTATPCGKCIHCTAIDEGRFVDLLEIDAASRTKVDDTRELLDNVQYKPAQGRYKVYLIDEVHMLSKHSFNALLKTLEEPPEYVKFLLATTDPQKLPITVLSRCLQFHLKAIMPEEIEKQLGFILQQEQASFDQAALAVIAKAANGSIRDALSLTDQALAFGSGKIDYQAVLKMLGTIDNSHLHYLLHFIVSGNVEKVFSKIEEFVHLGADFAKLHQALATLCHQVALGQMHGKVNTQEKTPVQLLSERLSPEEVQLYYQIAVQGYKDYSFAPNGKIAFEMTVMRLLAFKPANYIALDESQLKGEQPPQMQTPSHAVVAPIEREVTVDETEQAMMASPEEKNTVTVSDEQPQAFEEQPIIQTVEPMEAIETHNASGLLDNQEPTLQSEQITMPNQADSVIHSRNMLRSHRLKREQAKKLQATTVNQTTETVVANTTSPDATQPIVDKTKDQSVKESFDQVDSDFSAAKQVVQQSGAIPAVDTQAPSEALPPIESYLQDSFDNNLDGHVEEHNQQSHFPTSSNQIDTVPATLSNVENTEENRDVFSSETLDMPAFDIAHYVEDKLTDPWSLLIQELKLVGLIKLLAKNCVMKQADHNIILTLKASQQHLLNNSKICEQLQYKLKAHFGSQFSMYIEVGEVKGELTPIESEHYIFQQYLDNAKLKIKQDPNIKTWIDEYGAKIYENSILPL